MIGIVHGHGQNNRTGSEGASARKTKCSENTRQTVGHAQNHPWPHLGRQLIVSCLQHPPAKQRGQIPHSIHRITPYTSGILLDLRRIASSQQRVK